MRFKVISNKISVGSFDPQFTDGQLRHQMDTKGLKEKGQLCVVPKGSCGCCSTAKIPVGRAEQGARNPPQEDRVWCGSRGRLIPWGQQEIREIKLNELPVPSAIKGGT